MGAWTQRTRAERIRQPSGNARGGRTDLERHPDGVGIRGMDRRAASQGDESGCTGRLPRWRDLHAEPSVLRMAKTLRKPSFSAVQRAESLRRDAERKLQKNADDKLKEAER